MERHTLLYDEDCGFCRWATDRILRWDRRGRLRAATIQGPDGDRWLADLDPEARMRSWHLIGPDGRRASGGAAVAPLARLLPLGAPIAMLAGRFPGAAERAYRWVADHRDWLGRALGAQACSVDPTRPRRSRS